MLYNISIKLKGHLRESQQEKGRSVCGY